MNRIPSAPGRGAQRRPIRDPLHLPSHTLLSSQPVFLVHYQTFPHPVPGGEVAQTPSAEAFAGLVEM